MHVPDNCRGNFTWGVKDDMMAIAYFQTLTWIRERMLIDFSALVHTITVRW